MTAPAAAALINLLGFITGSVLYAMLLAMALGRQSVASSIGVGGLAGAGSEKTDRLPLLTALLGRPAAQLTAKHMEYEWKPGAR
jgi:hypothetical protein